MTRQRDDSDPPADSTIDSGRREFIARSIAAGVAVATGSAVAADAVVETDVNIKARDGT